MSAALKTDTFVDVLYKNLGGARGLAALEKEFSRPTKVLPVIEKLLGKRKMILDLCCGYGRIGTPLALRGYEVEGIDIHVDMIREGRKLAKRSNASIRFRRGDMRKLPYDSESFDGLICLWNSFNHLLNRREQISALKEAYRVLKPKGKGFFETMNGEAPTLKKGVNASFPIYELVIAKDVITPFFLHTRQSLQDLCRAAKIPDCRTYFKKLDGRKKLFLEIRK